MENMTGEMFLHKRNPKFHTTRAVEISARKSNTSQKPQEKIAAYLGRIERIYKGGKGELLEKKVYDNYLISQENIPESYFENQRRMDYNNGHGDVEIGADARDESFEVITSDQKSTLSNWIKYFSSSDSDSYPGWAKYWAMDGVLKLSSYDKKNHSFNKRNKSTVAPFPDLDREALATSISALEKNIAGEEISHSDDSEFERLVNGGNFGKIYSWAIENSTSASQSELSNMTGEWVKYEQGSDYMPLIESLQGHGTGWCTAGENTAKDQLQEGDFHVFYSEGINGENTVPRAAIRMKGEDIGEIRGIAYEQNLDSQFSESGILENKLNEFGKKGKEYTKKSSDMKRLTAIDNKDNLSKEDLRFLYEINESIVGFGYKEDPRIKEIRDRRDNRKDLAFALNIQESEVSLNSKEVLKGDIKCHYGDLHYTRKSTENLESLEFITGAANFNNLTSAKGLNNLNYIGKDAYFSNLTSAKGLNKLTHIGGHAWFSNLHSAKGLDNLRYIEESAYFNKLTHIGKSTYFNILTPDKGLNKLTHIGDSACFPNLSSAKGLNNLAHIGKDAWFSNLHSAKGLNNLAHIGNSACFENLTSAKELDNLTHIGKDAYFQSLDKKELEGIKNKVHN